MLNSNQLSLIVALLIGVFLCPQVADAETKTESGPPSFLRDVVPILTRYGCNSGGCHGKATGQNGFRLSLLGFEPDFDHVALLREGRGRRGRGRGSRRPCRPARRC